MEEHVRLDLVEDEGYRLNRFPSRKKYRPNRLEAIFEGVVDIFSEFSPVDLDCSKDRFLSLALAGILIRKAEKLLGISNQVGKICIHALFRKEPGSLMECPSEQPILFICHSGNPGRGVAAAFFPKDEPFDVCPRGLRDSPVRGEVWLALATLIVRDRLLAFANLLPQSGLI